MVIPKKTDELITVSKAAIRGLDALALGLGLKDITSAALTADLEAVTGRPAAGNQAAVRGKLTELGEARGRLAAARAALKVKQAEATTLGGKAVDSLKATLGRSWNLRWQTAGFFGGSINLSRLDPGVTLTKLAAYLREHPEQEAANVDVTAAKLQAGADALEAARGKRQECISQERMVREERELALQNLRARLRVLRVELDRVLSDTDARWYQFGFTRPADGHLPSPVTDLKLKPGTPGAVIVAWAASIVAINYRVTWRLKTGDPMIHEPGLYTDRQVLLHGLPSGQMVVVSVTARNRSGETVATEATIQVP